MKILVLGARGMMGHMAARVLAEQHEVFGTIRDDLPVDSAQPATMRFLQHLSHGTLRYAHAGQLFSSLIVMPGRNTYGEEGRYVVELNFEKIH